jgi:cysteine desulfuration protein SufE
MPSPTHLPEAIDRIVQRFQRLTDPKQRYEQLILYGKKLNYSRLILLKTQV